MNLKKYLLVVLHLSALYVCTYTQLQAQNAYKGGEGSGFAAVELSFHITANEENLAKTFHIISANPLAKSAVFFRWQTAQNNAKQAEYIYLIDAKGQKWAKKTQFVDNKSFQIDMSDLKTGLYLVEFLAQEQSFFYKLMLVD